MHVKTTPFEVIPQHYIHNVAAGILPGDNSTELFACRDSKKVFGISQGKTISFDEIPTEKRAQIFERLLSDPKAMDDLKHLPEIEALEQFAFCVFGSLDHQPDFCADGKLKAADNFMCSNHCKCVAWSSKKITVDGKPITPKKVEIIRLMATDMPDKQIAEVSHISVSTLNTHKAQIFALFDVGSTRGVVRKAIEEKIIQ